MNEQEQPVPPPEADPAASPSFKPEVIEPRRSPVAELKSWFRDLKSHVKGAVEEARGRQRWGQGDEDLEGAAVRILIEEEAPAPRDETPGSDADTKP